MQKGHKTDNSRKYLDKIPFMPYISVRSSFCLSPFNFWPVILSKCCPFYILSFQPIVPFSFYAFCLYYHLFFVFVVAPFFDISCLTILFFFF